MKAIIKQALVAIGLVVSAALFVAAMPALIWLDKTYPTAMAWIAAAFAGFIVLMVIWAIAGVIIEECDKKNNQSTK